MRVRSSLAFFAALLFATAAQASTAVLFHETFDGNLQNWSYTSTAARSYDNTWTEGDTVKPGYKGIKLGSTSVTGSITSESFSLSNTTESVSVTIVAAAYSNNGGGKEGIAVTVYDSSDATIFSDTVAELTQHTSTEKDEIPATATYTHVFTVPAASLPTSGGIHLKIESTYTKSGQRRALIGDVLVTQTIPSSGVNTAPTALQPSVDVAAAVGTAAELDLADYFSDADGDPLTYAHESGVGDVTGSIWSFTPESEGSFSAEVSATDPSGDSATMYLSVTAVLPPLSAPTIEPVRPEDATANGFVLRWIAVENAVGYEIVVTNVAEQMEAGFQVSYSGPFLPDDPIVAATVTGLDADTLYSAAVRALATTDPSFPSTSHSDSDWSYPVTIATSLEDGLQRAVLLNEGFSGAANAWGNTTAKPGDAETDCDSWSFSANAANGRSAIKVGLAGSVGWALSPEMTLSNEVAWATVSLSFTAAAYLSKTTEFSVSVVDLSTGDTNAIPALTGLAPTALESTGVPDLSDGTDYAETVTVPTHFKLLFETLSTGTDKRLLLDSIKVTQVYDPNYTVLAAPTGVADSNVGPTGFTVSWNTVAHAEGYEVWLDGAFKASCAAADTSMQLTGLTDGTTYSVQVKALGDNLHYGDSPLSTAISVTTPADAQKVDFTVTGAPTAPVFAGDTVSFTVTAEYESTHEAAPVSLSGIAGATFAAGAFSWTPTEGDVGSHTATFTSGEYSTNVAITVVSAMETRTLATENFSKITSTSWSATGYANEMDGDIGTWMGLDLVKTKSAVIVGRANSSGTIVSPAIDLPVRTPGSLSVSFDTGSLPDKQASFEAQILDAADGTVLYTTNFPAVAALPSTATAVADAGVRVTVAPGANIALPAAIQLSLTTSEGTGDNSYRVYIDTVVFAQTLSAKLRDLAAPTGLAVVGEPGENGFTVGWTAVSDATNYAVRVTDAAGAVVFSAPFCAAAPVAVSGLADDEAYAVQVRATGDEAVWTPSPWSDALAVRTARSSAHPTLSFGGWANAVGDGGLYAGVANTAAVSAVRDNGTNAVVTLESVSPAPTAGPTLEDGVLSWTPVDADTNKTFTISFLMDGTYATNLSFKVKDLAPLAPPTVTADPVEWDAFGLSWNTQYRAAGYAVRVWTDCPNPNATATRVEEAFAGWPKVKPAGWSYHNMSSGYKDAAAPVSFDATGDAMETYDLGGAISSVSFHAAGHSIAGSTSALTVVGIEADGTETVLATLTAADIGQTAAGIDRTYSVPAGVRKIAWRYTKDTGGVGVGSIVIEGSGFSTPRWLPGWGPAAKDVGLVPCCTVKKPRPGRFLGVDPSDPKKDLTEPRVNYAEVTVRDAAGTSLSAVVAVDVPAPPRSVRASMMIVR
jgi:hypothetical protein